MAKRAVLTMQKITLTLCLSLAVVVVASETVDAGDDTKGKTVVFRATVSYLKHLSAHFDLVNLQASV